MCLSVLTDCKIPEGWDHFLFIPVFPVTRKIPAQKFFILRYSMNTLMKACVKN